MKRAGFPCCWKCHLREREQAAYDRGWHEAARVLRPPKVQTDGRIAIDPEMFNRLRQLCHPDKHGGSSVATVALQWLNSIRPQIKAGAR